MYNFLVNKIFFGTKLKKKAHSPCLLQLKCVPLNYKSINNIYSYTKMKRLLFLLTIVVASVGIVLAQEKTSPLYTDSRGVWRRTSNNAEVSYYGVNYTLPFAHSYRAAGYLGVDRKKAIDEDVYHFARLGLNAFRVHIWDVEISDARGNVVANDHLDLLDYLISKLEERGIDIILTAQTNFGNGYPERNIITDGFSYIYDKCHVHSDSQAVVAQENYIAQLARHVNKYTGHSYSDDTCIVAFEINNEPCHSGSIDDTRTYINRMVKALKSTGFHKSILYNVTHNYHLLKSYFEADIDGCTYQWYPTGLVSGRTIRTNCLPYVDNYNIDFKDIPGFESKAKIVYEFDPADILATYMYPATARSFRTAGFQWITQFAYDAAFLAAYNTDYQTHYLNIMYTPGKAVGMKIAAEVAKEVPMYANFGKYPQDTVFLHTTVSYKQDLALFDNGEKFFYTNTNSHTPRDAKRIKEICGVGSSPVVTYSGTGVYFVDKLATGVWRLEVLPDHVVLSDPFQRPSLKKKTGILIHRVNKIDIRIPDLGTSFSVQNISVGASHTIEDGSLSVTPGVYILRSPKSKARIDEKYTFNNIAVGEYYDEPDNIDNVYLVHTPAVVAEQDAQISIDVQAIAPQSVDSVVVYPNTISFWSDSNPSLKLTGIGNGHYNGIVPQDWQKRFNLDYYIMVYTGGECYTFPSGKRGNPLDWDAVNFETYSTQLVEKDSPIVLVRSAADDKDFMINTLPMWRHTKIEREYNMPFLCNTLSISCKEGEQPISIVAYKDVKNLISQRINKVSGAKKICIKLKPANHVQKLSAGFTDSNGITYMAEGTLEAGKEVMEISLANLRQVPTKFLYSAYPLFCLKEFASESKFQFELSESEVFQIFTLPSTDKQEIGLVGAWIE